MLESLRIQMRRAEGLADTAAFAGKVVASTGLLASLSPSGVASYLRHAAHTMPGAHTALLLHACNRPERAALIDSRRRLSFSELNQEVNQLAHGLVSLGISSGDRVAIMMRNCNEYLVIIQALLRVGATAVQIGYRLKAAEISYLLSNASAKAVFFHSDYAEHMLQARAAAKMPQPTHLVAVGGTAPIGTSYGALLEGHDQHRPPRGRYSSAGSIMIYTSGTTGNPKGASRGLRDVSLVAGGDFAMQLGVNASERHLIVCPLYHSGAMGFCTLIFGLGATNVILEHFDPETVLQTIERERVTSAFLVPTMLTRLTQVDRTTRERFDLSSLRWICSGAAPLPTKTASQFQEQYGAILWNFYGSTETGLVTLAGPDDHVARPGTVGRALRGVQIDLRNEQGVSVPNGEVGELWVRSGMTLEGYHGDRARPRQNGWFSVGDLATRDEHGYYYLASRKSDMMISGGVNIYPREIEDRLCTHPAVLECAVVGLPSPKWGESVTAFVVLQRGHHVTEDELVAHCLETLADYKRPRSIQFLPSLPRTPTGKVLKRQLRDRGTAA